MSVSLVACVDPMSEPQESSTADQQILLEELFDTLPNNFPIPNQHGFAATFHTGGSVDLRGGFFTPQGTNGRSCGSCHAPEAGWSMTAEMATLAFLLSGGEGPLFVNNLDTDRPSADMSTVQARWANTTMLRKGLFTRKVGLPATRDYDLVEVNDPFGVSTLTNLFWFRRPQATANLRSLTVHWDSVHTLGDLRSGLMKQARAAVGAALQSPTPAPEPTIGEIADYQIAMSHAQTYVWGVGQLDDNGARGGPEHAAAQPLVAGRFDLYDAWKKSSNPKRRQIYRGQELFNNVNPPSGRRCGGCHNAANNGQNVGGAMFDLGVSDPALAGPDRAVFTFQSRVDGTRIRTIDPGWGLRDGQFAHLNKFKTPNLRGLASRAPYFHSGIAPDLKAVIRHYEVAFGFKFTKAEEDDLVAFMIAL